MFLKKIAFVGAIVGGLWAAVSPAYANDDVTFYIQVLNGDVTAADAPLTQSNGTTWQFKHTNIYKDDEVISSSAAQTQSGTIKVRDIYSGLECQFAWEHKFWKAKEKKSSKHDRFTLSIISGCNVTGFMISHNGLHKSGQTVSIYMPMPESTRKPSRGGNIY